MLYSGEEVAYPFIGKPDRNLYRDYYEVIHHPVSLRSIQKKVRGTDGRKKGTKMTAFPTWLSFEEEVSYLWRNAREYNEDGSEISVLAGVLEVSLFSRPCLLFLRPRWADMLSGLFPTPSGRGQEACPGSHSGRWSPRITSHQVENGLEQSGAGGAKVNIEDGSADPRTLKGR